MEMTGKLAHDSTLQIHTRQARQLIIENKSSQTTDDKKTYMIVGLEKFGASMNRIWRQIRQDDPYAEIALIEIERRIDNAFELLGKLHNTIDNQVSIELPGITMTFYQSETPAVIPLNAKLFETTHALLGARLIGHYDLLIRKLHTCQQFGLVNRNHCNRYKYKSAKALRGVYSAPLLYKLSGVNRQDILNRTEKGTNAILQLGNVPMAILTRETHSKYGPAPKAFDHKII